jgi:hypothetical protein
MAEIDERFDAVYVSIKVKIYKIAQYFEMLNDFRNISENEIIKKESGRHTCWENINKGDN